MTVLVVIPSCGIVVFIAGMCARDWHHTHQPRGRRRLTSWQRASSTIMWAEFEATQPMPGIDMDGKWPQ